MDKKQPDARYAMLRDRNDPRPLAEIAANIVRRHPIEMEKSINTLASPLIIECACPGWQPKIWPIPGAYPHRKPPGYVEGGIRYPAVPCTPEQEAAEIIAAAREGCSACHVHPRDADCFGTDDPQLLAEVYDLILKEIDIVSVQHTWEITPDGGIDFLSLTNEAIKAGGGSNRYVQGCVVLFPPTDSYPKKYREAVLEAVQCFRAHKIKPIYKVRGPYHVRELERMFEETGIVEEPLVIVHDMGHPFGWPMDIDPLMPVEMITALELTRKRFPQAKLGVFSGGRNWMPITMTAILYGIDMVQVGIEDFYYMYPHRDEVIQRNMDCIRKITDFCKLIGRELATVSQTREMLGIVRT